jgi:hypothetical protein
MRRIVAAVGVAVGMVTASFAVGAGSATAATTAVGPAQAESVAEGPANHDAVAQGPVSSDVVAHGPFGKDAVLQQPSAADFLDGPHTPDLALRTNGPITHD